MEGTATKEEFETLQRASDRKWDAFGKRYAKYCRTIVTLVDDTNPETSIWHGLVEKRPTLVGCVTINRAFARKTYPGELHRDGKSFSKSRYRQWGTSDAGWFLGADVEPFAPAHIVMPTQLITFKVGGENGYNGDIFYPYTTVGEDNFFSYEWGKTYGHVEQLDAVQILRKFPKKAVSITRKPDNLTQYTPCAIKELLYLISSDTYKQTGDATPTLSWTPEADTQSLRTTYYKWQAFIFSLSLIHI